MRRQFVLRGSVLAIALVVALALSYGGMAFATSNIYVNDGQNVLGTDINSAYAVGGGGEASGVGDTYVITGEGVVKIGQATTGTPKAIPNGSPVSVRTNTVRVGLYYCSNSRDTALPSARLENAVGSGYRFGYYDSNRLFHELGRTAETQITMTPTGNGQEVTVTASGSGEVLYVHNVGGMNLAVSPISNYGKAITWFKNNTYYGDFEYYRYVSDKLTVINVVPLEDYVKGVVPYEMKESWPVEALKAQAVCARTYFAKSVGNYSRYGFDVTADTYCQAYLGTRRATAASDAACDATAGQYLTYNGKLCTAFYFAADGGGTEDCENIFYEALPYCRGVVDPYEADIPSFYCKSWHKELTAQEISSKLQSRGITNLANVIPTYSDTGNVIKLVFVDQNGNKATVTKSNCSYFLGLDSVHFTIEKSVNDPNLYIIDGGGCGHNVGMSQWGAYSMAYYHGYNYRQILGFYFTGVAISPKA